LGEKEKKRRRRKERVTKMRGERGKKKWL